MAPQRQAHSIASSAPTKTTQQTLARRLLVPPHSNEDLPPLLSTQGLPPELTAELYDLIALALRAYVNPWWTKITRYDKEFLPHINKIVVHVVRSLEERLKAANLAQVVFHDLPTIITQHYVDYRNAHSKLSTSYAAGGSSSLPHLFGRMQPHMAMSPDGNINPEYYRQIVDHILKVTAPAGDHEPEIERSILREILVKIVVNDVIPKISQPWFIHKTILDLTGSHEDNLYDPQPVLPASSQEASFFHTLVVVILSALQSFSGICLALLHSYKQTVHTIKLVNETPTHSPRANSTRVDADNVVPPLDLPPSLANSRSTSTTSTISLFPDSLQRPTQSFEHGDHLLGPPIRMISEITCAQDRLSSTLFETTLAMLSYSMANFLDKLCAHLLTRFLSPGFILNIAKLTKRTLFPNGYPGPSPVEPTVEEQAELRSRLLKWRPKGGFSHILPLILGSDPTATLNTALDPLNEAECNTRLWVFILDRLLVALFPELVAG